MGQSYQYVEPTIWALRKNSRKLRQGAPTLYEHLYGYDPIKIVRDHTDAEQPATKISAENPSLNILNSQTGFLVRELASDEPPKA